MALDRSPKIASGQAEVAAAVYQRVAAQRDFLPELTIGSTYVYNTADSQITLPLPGDPQTIDLIQAHNIEVTGGVQWPLFTGFARQANLAAKRIGENLAQVQFTGTQTQVALQTVEAYRRVQGAKLQLESLNSGRDRLSLQLAQVKNLQDQGMASAADVISLELAALEYDQRILTAKSELKSAQDTLFQRVGMEIEVPSAIPEAVAGDLPDLRPDAVPSVQAQALRANLAQTQERLARAQSLPSLAVQSQVHYGKPGASPAQNEWMAYVTAGVSVNWSYDWGGTSAVAKSAESASQAASDTLRAAREDLDLQYRGAVDSLKAKIGELDLLDRAVSLTKEKLAIVQDQYDQGMATVTEYTEANLELTQAELRRSAQQLTIVLGLNRLEALSGIPVDEWSIDQ